MIVAAVLAAILVSSGAAVPRVLSVCEAARVGEGLDGKTVRIMGDWRSHSGSGLFDELLDNSCPGVEIHVVFTPSSLPHPPPAEYKLDVKSARNARRVAEKAVADGRDVSAMIVGLLYVQKERDYVQARPSGKGVTIPPHHKWYPLVLLVEAVPEIKER